MTKLGIEDVLRDARSFKGFGYYRLDFEGRRGSYPKEEKIQAIGHDELFKYHEAGFWRYGL